MTSKLSTGRTQTKHKQNNTETKKKTRSARLLYDIRHVSRIFKSGKSLVSDR